MAEAAQVQDQGPRNGEKGTGNQGRSRLLIIGAIATVVVVLALALGLGLGLGLKKNDDGTAAVSASASSPVPSSSPTPSSSPSNATGVVETWRRATTDYNLDMGWNVNAAPTTRMYNFTVSEIQAAPDGVNKTVFAINGQFPGPLIRVNRGDRVLVNVTNHLTNTTTMHWHGIYQNGTNWMDGSEGITQCGIPPGRSFLYNFTVENQYGTYWYHSHHSTQYIDGIVGPFIIHAPGETSFQEKYDYDQVILLSDWYHDLSSELLPAYLAPDNENNEPTPDNGLIQGTNTFDCTTLDPSENYTCATNSTQALFSFTPNKTYRLRLINVGGFTDFQFSIDNHTLAVIEADGTPVHALPVSRLAINIAQRYSLLLSTNQSSSTTYWMRASMNTYCFAVDNPVLNPDVRALLSYDRSTALPTDSVDWATGRDLVCQDLNDTLLVPAVSEPAPPATALYALTLSFQIGAYTLDRGYVNGTSWRASTVPTLNQAASFLSAAGASFANASINASYPFDTSTQQVLVLPLPSDQTSSVVVDVLLTNFDDGAHPFHLHGHKFWILATSPEGYFPWSTYQAYNVAGGLQNKMMRDTITIDAYGWALLRFRADNPGLWALHCHIVWHMEAGMLVQFWERRDIMATWSGLPKDVLELCNA